MSGYARVMSPTSLIIPPEIKSFISVKSGFIIQGCKFSDKAVKWLFLSPENKKYLAKELYVMLICEQFVKDNLPEAIEERVEISTDTAPITGYGNASPYLNKAKQLVGLFVPCRGLMFDLIDGMRDVYQYPFAEDYDTLNPVQQLHYVNKDFLVGSAKNIIGTPSMIVPGYLDLNPDTGADESNTEYDYGANSYADGVWAPEMLFTNSKRNRANPYWKPLEVNIHADPDVVGVTNIYNNPLYNQGKIDNPYYNYQSRIGPNAKKTTNGASWGSIPRWQSSVNDRPYQLDNTEGLRDGGLDDRRVQAPHGYSMIDLYKKPSY